MIYRMNPCEHSSERLNHPVRHSPRRWRACPALLPLLFLLLTRLLSFGQTYEAVSREISVFNFGTPFPSVEAISREVSVFNFGASFPSVEAVSREVSVFNFGAVFPSVEAISREVSVFNYRVPPLGFSVGSTNILGTEINQVPFTFLTLLDLTNLSLTLQADDSHLQILGVTPVSPEVVSVALGTVSSNGHPIAFTLNSGAIPATTHVLAWLNFQGITNLDSAIVPLIITHSTATRASGQVVPVATANGQVILIMTNSILVASAKPQFGITLYGLPGATYAIETTTNLALPDWQELERLFQGGPILPITGLTNTAAQQFYRTKQVGP